MVSKNGVSGGLEWRIRMDDGSSKILEPESGLLQKTWLGGVGLVMGMVGRVSKFFRKAWDIGVDDPRKVMHCLKVGFALTVVSLFYYVRPLYDDVGGNSMWAVLTVVVVFEHTVGATLSKTINRATGTCLAGALGVGVHWVASQSGETLEPIILRTSVFLLAAAATFSRFIPTVKARFDYGALIFILTFSLVSVSGYRVEHLFELARDRLSTVVIGSSMCLLISMLICPIWAGQDLHLLITRNMEKLADSLDGCIVEYFNDEENTIDNKEESPKNLLGYKCVLNTKATEESLANFARWEPAHGRFGFCHPWKQYLKIGASMRNCAYCIEALNGCINSEIEAPEFTKKHFNDVCMRLSSVASAVLKELAVITKTMRKSLTIDFSLKEMKTAVQDLENALKSFPEELMPLESAKEAPLEEKIDPIPVPLVEILPLVTAATLMIEITARIEAIVDGVDELASLAHFKPSYDTKPKETQLNQLTHMPNTDEHQHTMKTMQQVVSRLPFYNLVFITCTKNFSFIIYRGSFK